jgi:hypothetical protein
MPVASVTMSALTIIPWWLGPDHWHGHSRHQRHDHVPRRQRPNYWHGHSAETLNLAAAEVALLATIVAHPALTTAPPPIPLEPGAPVEHESHLDTVGQQPLLDAPRI